MNTKTVIIDSQNSGLRLDKCLTIALPDFSRSRIQQLILEGCVFLLNINTAITDSAKKTKIGEKYQISLPEAKLSKIKANNLDIDIIFEDKHLLVINKQAGMTVHPAPGHYDDTLVNALLSHCGDSLSGIGGVMRPGIVHRIDKDTSGLLVVAKHDIAHRFLAAQLAEHKIKREYLAVVKGVPKPVSGIITGNIARSNTNRKKMAVVKNGGKTAITHYKTEEIFANNALLRCVLETGRTHQIRVHLAHIGFPIVGDQVYGRKDKKVSFFRQALHAEKLTFIHPESKKEMQFYADLPDDIKNLLRELEK